MPNAANTTSQAGTELELVIGARTCVIVRGTLHCRGDAASIPWHDDFSLGSAPTYPRLDSVTSASFGEGYGCATKTDGTVACFGENYRGQLGAGLRDALHYDPVTLPGVNTAARVVAGPAHACAILRDGNVSCWGANDWGQNGSSTNYLEAARELVEPEVVAGITNVTALALTRDATCATTSTALVSCWGRALHPEQRAVGPANEHPTQIASLAGATSLTANASAFCAIKDEKIVCWGETGEIAPNATRGDTKTLDVPHARRVRLGSSYGCALDADGNVRCFGHNRNGELGVLPPDSTWTASDPTKVVGIPPAVDIMCGLGMACALTAKSELWCWGRFDWSGAQNEGMRRPRTVRIL